jgi:hypothetical protein
MAAAIAASSPSAVLADLPTINVPDLPNVFDAYADRNNTVSPLGQISGVLADLPVTEIKDAPSIFSPYDDPPNVFDGPDGSGSEQLPFDGDYADVGLSTAIPVVTTQAAQVTAQQQAMIAEALKRRRAYMLGSYQYAQGGAVDAQASHSSVVSVPGFTGNEQFAALPTNEYGMNPSLGIQPPLSMYTGSVGGAAPQTPDPKMMGFGPLSQIR